eukprot:sb/3466907/
MSPWSENCWKQRIASSEVCRLYVAWPLNYREFRIHMSGDLYWRSDTPKKPGSVRRTSELMKKKARTRSEDEVKFEEFNNKTDDAWLDDSQTDLEFYVDPRDTAGMGLSKLNIRAALDKPRPHLLPRQVKESTTTNIYGTAVRPVQTTAGTSSSQFHTNDVDLVKRHTVNKEEKQKARFSEVFKSDCPDLDAIKKAAWFGCPRQDRPLVWQILSGYLPPNKSRRADTLSRKRSEYWRFVAQYFKTRTDANFASLYHQRRFMGRGSHFLLLLFVGSPEGRNETSGSSSQNSCWPKKEAKVEGRIIQQGIDHRVDREDKN